MYSSTVNCIILRTVGGKFTTYKINFKHLYLGCPFKMLVFVCKCIALHDFLKIHKICIPRINEKIKACQKNRVLYLFKRPLAVIVQATRECESYMARINVTGKQNLVFFLSSAEQLLLATKWFSKVRHFQD